MLESPRSERKIETQEAALVSPPDEEADQQTAPESTVGDKRTPSPEEEQYKIAEKLYNKLFIDKTKYQHVQDK